MTRSRRSRQIGREAVEHLKMHYRDGEGDFPNIWAIVTFLKSKKIKNVGHIEAQAWDRQARLELADELTAVTYPSRVTGFRRQAQATADERRKSRKTRHRDTNTRVTNDLREAKAAAAQADATSEEIAIQALLESATQLTHTVKTLIENGQA